MKIAIVSCYDQTEYPRARIFRAGFAEQDGVEVTIIRNQQKGLLRYIEVPAKILAARFRVRPDAYVITFRGYEMLLYMVLTLVRKPIIFDELVNFEEWMYENNVLKQHTLASKLFNKFYAWQLRRCRVILADTQAHAEFSSSLSGVPLDRYVVIPVGTDESMFQKEPLPKVRKKTDPFTVIYGGAMKRLHGLPYLLDAAVALKDDPRISFIITGGKEKTELACKEAAQKGARITFKPWVDFVDMPKLVASAGLNVAGPFGNTLQSQYVVTGKTFHFLAAGVAALIGKNKVQDGFKDKENCLLVPQADSTAIREAIVWAADHPEELRTIGAAGHKLYEKRFSKAVIYAQIRDLTSRL